MFARPRIKKESCRVTPGVPCESGTTLPAPTATPKSTRGSRKPAAMTADGRSAHALLGADPSLLSVTYASTSCSLLRDRVVSSRGHGLGPEAEVGLGVQEAGEVVPE